MTRTQQARTTDALRGEALDVLAVLVREQRTDEIIELVQRLVARNAELERRLAEMLTRRNKPNEGVSTSQLVLLLDGLATPSDEARSKADEELRNASGIDDEGEEKPKRPKRGRERSALRRPLPASLRRVDNPLRVPDEERGCPQCGVERTCIGHDVTEVVELIPAELIVRRDMREKLACTECESHVVRGPVGDKVVASGRIGVTLASELMIAKYDEGMPLHRQKQRFERLGLSLPVSTLADQIKWCTELLQPVANACLDAVLAAEVMHIDGTSLPVLARKHAKGKKLGALWGMVGGQTAAYAYASTGKKSGQRPGELGPEDILARRVGPTVADADSVFDASFKRDDLIECGCNVHARRYFIKAMEGGDNRAALPLAAFKKLYDIERQFKDADAQTKQFARQQQSEPVYDELVNWCRVHQPHEPPKSPMGRAIRYLLNHREALMRFLGDGRIPPDNSPVERLHVRAALTRKNYLFAGSDAGADRAAIAYTILGSCRLVDANPHKYLAEVLPQLMRGIRLRDAAALIPARWMASRASPGGNGQG
jgi:transposase